MKVPEETRKASLGDARHESGWAPRWARALTLPVWVSDSRHQLTFVNSVAGKLLGRSPPDLLGLSCAAVVAGLDERSLPRCGRDCPVRRMLRRGQPIPPFEIRVADGSKNPPWYQIIVIATPAQGKTDPHFVHLALPRSRAHRLEDYLGQVATRSRRRENSAGDRAGGELTARETEILDLLARDIESREVADLINVSYATVRNHVPRILVKLEVHSIQEAVARYLFSDDS